MSHTGGALPFRSGRMDKNSKAAKLPQPVSTYLKRMYTDTVSPHTQACSFAIDYYGIDNVMYHDYRAGIRRRASSFWKMYGSASDKQKLFYSNARRILGLKDPAPSKTAAQRERRWPDRPRCGVAKRRLQPCAPGLSGPL